MKAAIAGFLVLVGACVYLYVDSLTPDAADSPQAAARVRGLNLAPGSAGSTVTAPGDATGGDLAHVDAALRTAERLVAQPGPGADVVPATVAPADPGPVAPAWQRTAPSQRGNKARGSSRLAIAPATAAAPVPEAPRPVLQATVPAAPIGPCTPNVAALGLCAAPSSQPKE